MLILKLKTFEEIKHIGSAIVVPTYKLQNKPFIRLIYK